MLGSSLQSERLDLKPFESTDFSLFHQINTDPFVRKYLWDDESISLETAKEILQKNTKHFQNDEFGLWKIQLKTEVKTIGYAGLWYFYEEAQPQLIYALLPSYSGNGFAIEAAQLVLNYAFNDLGFNYLIAATDEANLASVMLAQKLGMHFREMKIMYGRPTLFYRIEKK